MAVPRGVPLLVQLLGLDRLEALLDADVHLDPELGFRRVLVDDRVPLHRAHVRPVQDLPRAKDDERGVVSVSAISS